MTLEEVLDALRRRIVDQDLPPGAKLREIALAEEFGISRPRLREAFGILEERGLVERTMNHGTAVARLSVDQVESLFDVREVLEALAVRLATQNAAPGTWDSFRDQFGAPARRALDANDLDYYIGIVHDFRLKTIEEARNPILSQTLDTLYDRTRVLIRRIVLMPGRALAALEEHQSVLEAMIAGDAARAEQLKLNNIRSARRWFSEYKDYLL